MFYKLISEKILIKGTILLLPLFFLFIIVSNSQNEDKLRQIYQQFLSLSDGNKRELDSLNQQLDTYFNNIQNLTPKEKALIYIVRGGILVQISEYPESLQILLVADSLSQNVFGKYSDENLLAKTKLAEAYGYNLRLDKERELTYEVINVLKTRPHPDSNKIADLYHTLAMNYGANIVADRVSQQDMIQSGLLLMNNYHPITIQDSLKQNNNLANLYNTLSISSYSTGNYSDAQTFALKSLLYRKKLPLNPERAINYMFLGRSIYKSDLNIDTALFYIDSCLTILEENDFKNSPQWLTYMSYKAEILIDAGKLANAIYLTQNVLNNLPDSLKLYPVFIGSWVSATAQLSRALIKADRTSDAVKVCKPIADIVKQHKFYSNTADVSLSSQYAYALSKNKQWELAEKEFSDLISATGFSMDSLKSKTSTLPIIKAYQYLVLYWQYGDMLVSKGFDQRNSDDVKNGMNILNKAISAYNKSKEFFSEAGINEENNTYFDIQFQDAFLNALYNAKGLINENERMELAYGVIENAKANLLKSRIYREKQLLDLLPESTMQIARELRNNIFKAMSNISSGQSTDNNSLLDAKFAYSRFSDSLRKIYHVEQYPGSEKLSANDTTLITNKATIINYFLGDQYLHVYIHSSGKQYFIQKPVLKDLDQDLQFMRSNYLVQSGLSDDSLSNRMNIIENKWFRWLLGDIELQHEVVIIPHRQLSFISFEMLSNGSGRNNAQYLLLNHTIRYELAAALMKDQNRKANSSDLKSFIGFSASNFKSKSIDNSLTASNEAKERGGSIFENLPSTESEVKDAASKLNGTFYQHTTKDILLNKLSKCKVTTLATHVLSDQGPYHEANIVLEDQNNGYSIVKDVDIMQMQLQTDLTVLSACNTGTGRIIYNEGPRSLGRAFILAGCPSIVMSLWQAPSKSTTEIMGYFYTNLSKGKNKATALHDAKVQYLKNAPNAWKHPYYWAGFVLVGNNQPLDFTNNNNNLLFIFIPLIAIICSIMYYYFRKKIIN